MSGRWRRVGLGLVGGLLALSCGIRGAPRPGPVAPPPVAGVDAPAPGTPPATGTGEEEVRSPPPPPEERRQQASRSTPTNAPTVPPQRPERAPAGPPGGVPEVPEGEPFPEGTGGSGTVVIEE